MNLRAHTPSAVPTIWYKSHRDGKRSLGNPVSALYLGTKSWNGTSRNHPLENGFTLVELLAAITILLLLTSVALPVMRVHVQRTHELELHRALRQLRDAIDRYKDFSDRGMIPIKADTFGYPPDLQTLVEGVPLKGAATAKYKFLRRIPVDPMTGEANWGLRSMQDDPDSRSWGGQNVFDVYSKTQGTAMDGTPYADW